MSNYEEIQNALSYIDARDRDTWFEVGAALKDELGEDGYALWDNWSQSAESYKSQDAKAVWKSIKPRPHPYRIHVPSCKSRRIQTSQAVCAADSGRASSPCG